MMNPSLIPAPEIISTRSELQFAEPYIIDLASLIKPGGREKAVEVIRAASKTGLLHVINHGVTSDDIHFLRSVGYTYMTTRTLEEKDQDSERWCKKTFEGYKPRPEADKLAGRGMMIEEYNYDYFATGHIVRPPVIAANETRIQKIFDYIHKILTPILLSLINEFSELIKGELERVHEEASEIAHFVMYRPGWDKNETKRRAQYAGHTDIGTLTYLTANPSASLQVYTQDGWRHVQYIPDSFVVNAGDAMEFVTKGKFNATLHRLVKPQPDQTEQPRLSCVYFINPNHETMTKALSTYQSLWERQTIIAAHCPGAPVNGACLNRLISAVSAGDHSEYMQVLNSEAWNIAKEGGLVSTPTNFVIDYCSRAIFPMPISRS